MKLEGPQAPLQGMKQRLRQFDVMSSGPSLLIRCRSQTMYPLTAARPTGSRWKNPAAPAVKREAEEDWVKERWR
jgi:hypothetical protein